MNDEDRLEAPLLSLAQKIAEGSNVNPEHERHAAVPDSSQSTLESLLEIAAISAAHREAEEHFTAAPAEAPAAARQWGHLIILEAIGSGEFGEVYRAHDPRLQIDVALKLSPAVATGSGEASRVLGEARLLAKVRHENVVRVYGADQKQGRVGLWMDLVQGQTLEELTRTQGFSEREAVNVGVELCRALAAVHRVGVLHGDIKAHNVIRQDGGRYVLVDFGAGRPLAITPEAGRDLIGTPVYLAPEVLEGKPRSTASDIYSLGVLLFHLVTNDYPVFATTREAFLDAHRTGARKQLRDLRANLSDGFVALVERATASDPGQRFESAGSLEGALVQVISPPRPAAATPAIEARATAPISRNEWKGWALGGAGVIVALWAVSALWPWASADSAKPGEVRAVTAVASEPGSQQLPAGSYEIEAAFYRIRGNDEERLTSASRLRLHDQVRMSVQSTAPAYVYVVNEDEKGNAFLLYPLPSQGDIRPLPPNTSLRLPEGDNWQVDSVGDKEHFLVFASMEPLTAFQDAFKKLAAPRDRNQSTPLPPNTIDTFRGVGGVTPVQPRPTIGTRFRDLFTTPLEGRETARGLWVRQLTIANSEP